MPTIEWLQTDGSKVNPIPRLRHVLSNGTLVLFPFPAEAYRQDVHASIYKCRASNNVGTVISKDIRVRAVVVQVYEAQVYDEFVIAGNTALMKCQIPSFVADYVSVTSWIRDESFPIHPTVSNIDGKYFVLPTGELQIQDVRIADGFSTYRCQTVHQLTGESRLSSTAGRLFVTDPHGTVPPRISENKISMSVKQGDTAVLPCTAQAFPIPTYSWYKRSEDGKSSPLPVGVGRIVPAGGNLIVNNVEIQDRGIFVCMVHNPVGSERVEVSLSVTAPLSAFIQPPKLQVDIGQQATFQCVVSGYPVSSLIWLKDGKLVTTNATILVSYDMLRITTMTKKHRGSYQCIISNDVDCVQASAELRLGDIPPSILHLSSVDPVFPNHQASFKCVASGSPLPELTWTLDDLTLPTQESIRLNSFRTEEGNAISYLNISQVKTKDGGRYTCIALNKVATVEQSTRLEVYGPPFIRQMARKSVIAGDTVVLHCPYGGHPIESVLWEKGGWHLPIHHLQVVYPNGTLKLQNVQRTEDAGTYTCVVQNTEGVTARRDLEVMVLVPPKINPSSFQDTRLHEGSHARIICAVIEGDLPIAFTWLKERRPISSELGVSIRDFDEFSSVLTISKASTEHGGNYTCVAKNLAASDSYTALVTVSVPPRWTMQPQDVTTFPGLRIVIDCQATGYPIPMIKWLKAVDGFPGEYEDLRNDLSFYQLENGSLVFESATEKNKGRYLCRASNGIGHGLSKVVNVNVKVPVRFDVRIFNLTVRKGDDAKLPCSVRGDRPIRFSWSRREERLNPSTNPRLSVRESRIEKGMSSELTIKNVQKKDADSYYCVAENDFGKDEAHLNIIIIEPPDSPKDLALINRTSKSISISWSIPKEEENPVSHFMIQLKKSTDSWQRSHNTTVSGKESTSTFEDLLPAMKYECRIYSINTAGISGASDLISFTTMEEAPSGPPQDVRAEANDGELVKVFWKPPKREHWNGIIRGYYVGFRVYQSSEPYSFLTVETTKDSKKDLAVTLEDLRPYTKYSIVVQAFNHVGTSPRSNEVAVLTSEDAPSLPPQNVRCSTLSSHSLQVSWDPPVASSINGILQGYRVICRPDDEWYDLKGQTLVTTGFSAVLSGLLKYTNYSLQVSVFTRIGDGPRSEPIYCTTHEDVPDAPSDIKVLVTASDSALVAWKPPNRSNGILKKYTIYMRRLEHGKEDITKHTVPTSVDIFEISNLKVKRRYEFWVTASTIIGEGQSTPVVPLTISGQVVPARLISFGGAIKVPWRTSLDLHCKAIGIPSPQREWKFRGKRFVNTDMVFIQTDGTLRFKEVQVSDEGNYTCSIANMYGSDEIHYFLRIKVPPVAPSLRIASTTSTTLTVQWNPKDKSKTPILGYYLYYKREFGEWIEEQLDPDYDRYLITKLECGTKYQLYIAAMNKLGVGDPSEVITSKTEGEAPIAPKLNTFLREDITFVTLLLEAWASGGCPVLYFVVHYRRLSQPSWRLVSNNVLLQQKEFIIPDLVPATWYALRVTAHNNAGSTEANYEFATRTPEGGTVSPLDVIDRNGAKSNFFSDLVFIIIIVICGLVVIITCIFICNKRRRQFRQHKTAADTTTYASAPISSFEDKELATYKEKNSTQVYPHISLGSNVRDDTLPRSRRVPVHQMQQCPRTDCIYTEEYSTPVMETDTVNLNGNRQPIYNWPVRSTPVLHYDHNVPDLLEHGPESTTSNESSPDLHSLDMTIRHGDRRRAKVLGQSGAVHYPGLRPEQRTEETTFVFKDVDPKDAGYEEEDVSDGDYDNSLYKSDPSQYISNMNSRPNPASLFQSTSNFRSYYEDNTIPV